MSLSPHPLETPQRPKVSGSEPCPACRGQTWYDNSDRKCERCPACGWAMWQGPAGDWVESLCGETFAFDSKRRYELVDLLKAAWGSWWPPSERFEGF